jgi:hypothetical protein
MKSVGSFSIVDHLIQITFCPTQRAPDLGYAPRFLSFFLALAESRFEGESTLPPQAGNASRWAVEDKRVINKRQ